MSKASPPALMRLTRSRQLESRTQALNSPHSDFICENVATSSPAPMVGRALTNACYLPLLPPYMKGHEGQPDPSWQTAKGAGDEEGLVISKRGRRSFSCQEHFPMPSAGAWVMKAKLASLPCRLPPHCSRRLSSGLLPAAAGTASCQDPLFHKTN